MPNSQPNYRIIISGGGTGGHIFPALSIANSLKAHDCGIEILFVGALGRMEMDMVPKAGYKIIGLPIAGLQRRLTLQNLSLPFKVAYSLYKAWQIIRQFKPHVVVGVGGYASAPVLRAASMAGIPTLIQEQNSYAGVTNRLLAARAKTICVAYDHMERYFPVSKIILTGNPVRQDIVYLPTDKSFAANHFGLQTDKHTILIIGGSLGSRTLNNSLLPHLTTLVNKGYQVLWQCGRNYIADIREQLQGKNTEGIVLLDFIARMDLAYTLAEIIVSRAGAGTISELALVGKPVILVPSPNVAEDHQTKNALALTEKQAAILITDKDAPHELVPRLLALAENEAEKELLGNNLKKLAITDSAERIKNEILKIAKPYYAGDRL